jgi:CDP-paratose 2-epimerase
MERNRGALLAMPAKGASLISPGLTPAEAPSTWPPPNNPPQRIHKLSPPLRILVTGVCGFVGCTVATALLDATAPGRFTIIGIDNLSRPGTWINLEPLKRRGVRVLHGDIRNASDLEAIGPVDWLVDAAANASVLAGVDGTTSSRQLVEHNLLGTLNVLEFCKKYSAGLILLSTSRVYSIPPLSQLELTVVDDAFVPAATQAFPAGIGPDGIAESYSTAAPVSLYGATKLASEQLVLEYSESFGFPVWINRCGVLAGAGQFGHPAQGIFSFWINACLRHKPLRYIGFQGKGHQVRDCLHPRDVAALLLRQLESPPGAGQARVQNVSGGIKNSLSLAQLSAWCEDRFGAFAIESDPTPRLLDLPWVVLDSSLAAGQWSWHPQIAIQETLAEIAGHAEAHPEWLEISGVN